MKIKRTITVLAIAVSSLTCGCVIVPTDFMPKLTWHWSKDAKEYRREKEEEKQYRRGPQHEQEL